MTNSEMILMFTPLCACDLLRGPFRTRLLSQEPALCPLSEARVELSDAGAHSCYQVGDAGIHIRIYPHRFFGSTFDATVNPTSAGSAFHIGG
jgi:hypothetical protein